jgi:hypothetical protein
MSELIHVTEAIAGAGFMDHRWCQEWHLDRGTALHQATAILDRGLELDPETVDPSIELRLAQYRRFIEEHSFRIVEVETPLEDAVLGITGTPDRIVESPRGHGRFILDLKGAEAPWHALQIAAYARMTGLVGGLNLYVSDSGCRPKWQRGPRDFKTFLSALVVYRWRLEYGLVTRPDRTDRGADCPASDPVQVTS